MIQYAVVISCFLAIGCEADRCPYDLSTGDEIKFLLGPPGVVEDLERIEAGETLSHKWTLIMIPADILEPTTVRADIDLTTPGIRVSHEWDADDPFVEGPDLVWVRLDMTTRPGVTTGQLTFDRSDTPDNGVILLMTWEGQVDLYDSGEISHHRLELATGTSCSGR